MSSWHHHCDGCGVGKSGAGRNSGDDGGNVSDDDDNEEADMMIMFLRQVKNLADWKSQLADKNKELKDENQR